MVKRLVIFLSLIFLCSGVASAAEFSADTITTSKGHTNTGKVYFGKDRVRVDIDANNTSTITRIDKKVIWTIMRNKNMYLEKTYDNTKNRPVVEEKLDGELERKQVDSETIDGHPAKKYLVTFKSDAMENQVYQWVATDINFPIKTAGVDGSWTKEYKNIKFGAQKESLFEVPEGYMRFQIPAQ